MNPLQHECLFLRPCHEDRGATLYERFSGNFGPGEVYPEPGIDPDMRKAYFRIDHLMGLPASRLARTRFFSGHFPLVAAEMLDVDLQAFSLLREPVSRTVSLLRSLAKRADETRSLEEIYEDPFIYATQIQNHQTKLFALTPGDHFESLSSWRSGTSSGSPDRPSRPAPPLTDP
jgi:hypothetical protein